MHYSVFEPPNQKFQELRRLWVAALKATKSQTVDGKIEGQALDFFIEQLGAALEFDTAARNRINTQAEGVEQQLRRGEPMELVE